MPELIEVEIYRRLADRLVGSTVESVETPDAWFIKGGATPAMVQDAVTGAEIIGTGRIGKLLTVDLGPRRPVLGLRFGMTGRLVLDGDAPIERLEYGSGRDVPAWNRFAVNTTAGERLRLSDPRRLGGVLLDPDQAALGPEASTISTADLRSVLAGGRVALKARLLDQSRIAGLGNLLIDETLWRAGLDPTRLADSLDTDEMRALARVIRGTVRDLTKKGGSHTGDLQDERHRGGHCPTDGTPLDRRTVGGRTTYSCPAHQR